MNKTTIQQQVAKLTPKQYCLLHESIYVHILSYLVFNHNVLFSKKSYSLAYMSYPKFGFPSSI